MKKLLLAVGLFVFGCASLNSLDKVAGAAEVVAQSAYHLSGDLTRTGVITTDQNNCYITKIDAAVTTMRVAQDAADQACAAQTTSGTAACSSSQATTIASGALAALQTISASLAARQAGGTTLCKL